MIAAGERAVGLVVGAREAGVQREEPRERRARARAPTSEPGRHPLPVPRLAVRRQVVDEREKNSRIPANAIGQRRMLQSAVNAPPRSARLAIASPSGPPKTISRSSPPVTSPVSDDEQSEISLSSRTARLLEVVGAVDRLEHRARRAARRPERADRPIENATPSLPCCRTELSFAAGSCRCTAFGATAEEVRQRVVARADQPEEADDEDHAREEREQ